MPKLNLFLIIIITVVIGLLNNTDLYIIQVSFIFLVILLEGFLGIIEALKEGKQECLKKN